MKRFSFIIMLCIVAFSCQKESERILKNDFSPNIEVTPRHAVYNNFQFITPCEAGKIAIFNQCADDNLLDPIIQAVNEYNGLNSSINIRVLNSVEALQNWVNKVDGRVIFLDCNYNGPCGTAQATGPYSDQSIIYPSGGSIGNSISISRTITDCPCNDPDHIETCNIETPVDFDCIVKRAVMISISATLGLALNGDIIYPDTEHIAGTPTDIYDPTSVFNNPNLLLQNCDYCDANCEFNENDILAIETLYSIANDNIRCYCDCIEDEHGGKPGDYVPVRMEIDCCDERTCEEIFDGDPLFDCLRKVIEEDVEEEEEQKEECYCECKEEDYGGEPGDQIIIKKIIDCNDERRCEDILGEELLYDCVKKRG